MKTKTKGLIALIVVIVAAIYYYVTIPAINIHSTDTWGAVLFLIVIALIVKLFFYGFRNPAKIRISDLKESKILRAGVILLLVLGAVYFIGSILSSPIVNTKKYQKLMKVEQGNFTEDVEELSFDKIPLLDRDTAALLGDRKMGSMVDMVSQFEADDIYSQINYKDNPVRVTPLRYASIIKWFTNRSEGIPAYIRINMANQNTELVKLDKGMKYVNSEYFNRNIYRHLRFAHPTYIRQQMFRSG